MLLKIIDLPECLNKALFRTDIIIVKCSDSVFVRNCVLIMQHVIHVSHVYKNFSTLLCCT